MKITQHCIVVLLRRSENEKTPLTVMPHEIEVLKALHGDDNVIETEDKPAVKSVEFDPEEEYTRLQGLYIGNDRVPNPVREGVGSVEEFVAAFENVGGGEDNERKTELIEEAKKLGLKATKNWGIEKLETEIAAAKTEKIKSLIKDAEGLKIEINESWSLEELQAEVDKAKGQG